MANEVQVNYAAGATVYFLVRNATGSIWNGSAFEAYVTANYTTYDVAMTQQGTASGFYAGNFPSTISPGVYSIVAKNQVGGTPAETDPTVAVGDYQWNGTVTLPLSDLATSGQLGTVTPIRLARGVAFSGFPFYMVSSADHVTPFISGVVSGQISRDGAAFGAFQSGTVTEMGLGWFKISITSGDLLANVIAMNFTGVGISGGGADPRNMSVILQRVSGQNA